MFWENVPNSIKLEKSWKNSAIIKQRESHLDLSCLNYWKAKIFSMKILKAATEKQFITHRGTTTLTSDFSSETVKARKQWSAIFKVTERL